MINNEHKWVKFNQENPSTHPEQNRKCYIFSSHSSPTGYNAIPFERCEIAYYNDDRWSHINSGHMIGQGYYSILYWHYVYMPSFGNREKKKSRRSLYGKFLEILDLPTLDMKSNELIKKYRSSHGLETPNNRIDSSDLKMIIVALDDMGYDVVKRLNKE